MCSGSAVSPFYKTHKFLLFLRLISATHPPLSSTPLWRIIVLKFASVACGVAIGLTCYLLTWQNIAVAQEKTGKAKKKGGAQSASVAPIAAVNAFLATLDEAQKSRALLTYDSEKRVVWNFVPLETRKGLPLMDMSAEQQAAARAAFRSVVSQLGYDKGTTIMQYESILLKLEGPKSEGRRNPVKYYVTVYGTPAAKQPWGLSIEGHHMSLNFSLNGNQIVDSTPQFMGSNPAELKDNYGDNFPKGMRVLKEEEELAFQLVNSLDEKQSAAALLAGELPKEIRGATEPQPPTDAAQGIAASALNAEQKALLKELIEAYSDKMKSGVVKQRWALIEEAGFDKIKFAWAGAKKAGIGHYYIVQGPTFLIEFINVQADAAGNPANHIHCVWRDLSGDFNLPIASK